MSGRDHPPPDPRAFSLHRQSGWSAALAGLFLALVVEALPVHLWLARGHPLAAWISTAMTLLVMVALVRDARALGRHPTRLENGALDLRVGTRWRARVPLGTIASLTTVRGAPPPRRAPGYLRATVIGDPRFLLELREPVMARGPWGLERHVTRIGLAPDEPARFERALNEALGARPAPAPGPAPRPAPPPPPSPAPDRR